MVRVATTLPNNSSCDAKHMTDKESSRARRKYLLLVFSSFETLFLAPLFNSSCKR